MKINELKRTIQLELRKLQRAKYLKENRIQQLEGIKKGKMVHLNEYFKDIGKMKLGDTTIDVGYAKMDLVPADLL